MNNNKTIFFENHKEIVFIVIFIDFLKIIDLNFQFYYIILAKPINFVLAVGSKNCFYPL
jgi:hypothetical protein